MLNDRNAFPVGGRQSPDKENGILLKKLLVILPANTYRAQRFLEAARKLGVDVFIATDSDFSPPDPSNSVIDGISFCDPKEAGRQIADIIRHQGPMSVLAVDEAAVEVAEWTRVALGLIDHPNSGILATRDKRELRQRLRENNISQPKTFDILELEQGRGEIPFPVVVKPSKGSGSIGVTKAQNQQELTKSLITVQDVIAKMTISNQCIVVEEYIPGVEFAVDILVTDGKLHVLVIFEKPDPLVGPFFAETIYVTPPHLTDSQLEALHSVIQKCIRALSINNGPLHLELRLTSANDWVPIDIASRSIGGNCSNALAFASNTSLEELIIQNALGLEVINTQRERRASGVYMIPAETLGTLVAVHGVEAALKVRFVEDIQITVKPGTKTVPLPFDNQYLGFIFAKAPGAKTVEKALRTARALLEIEVDSNFDPPSLG